MFPIQKLHEKYIKGTKYEALIPAKKAFLCHLTYRVKKVININASKVYISTYALKHIYDTKTAEQYEFILINLHDIVRYPNRIYKNKESKRGDFVFIKKIQGDLYLCSIEVEYTTEKKEIKIATSFRTKENYLKKYELLWSWRDDIPSS
jgi:hypothetical protein